VTRVIENIGDDDDVEEEEEKGRFYFHVLYDDDDEEDISWRELEPCLRQAVESRHEDPVFKNDNNNATTSAPAAAAATAAASTPLRVKRKRTEENNVLTLFWGDGWFELLPSASEFGFPKTQAPVLCTSTGWISNVPQLCSLMPKPVGCS